MPVNRAGLTAARRASCGTLKRLSTAASSESAAIDHAGDPAGSLDGTRGSQRRQQLLLVADGSFKRLGFEGFTLIELRGEAGLHALRRRRRQLRSLQRDLEQVAAGGETDLTQALCGGPVGVFSLAGGRLGLE